MSDVEVFFLLLIFGAFVIWLGIGLPKSKNTKKSGKVVRFPPLDTGPSKARPAAKSNLHGYAPIAIPECRIIHGRCRVIDGDTIVIGRTHIRLAGIDAPELDQPYGQKSKWAMVALCKGREIRAELTGDQSYNRLVATCFLEDGRDIGAELIKQGLAPDGGHFSQGKYRHLEPKGIRWKLQHAYRRKQVAARKRSN